jgi:hypothetical protein
MRSSRGVLHVSAIVGLLTVASAASAAERGGSILAFPRVAVDAAGAVRELVVRVPPP